MDQDQRKTDRGGFLRRLGVLAAAGLGIAAFPEPAFAVDTCCPSSCMSCPAGQKAYFCQGCGLNCCLCLTDPNHNNCRGVPCPCG